MRDMNNINGTRRPTFYGTNVFYCSPSSRVGEQNCSLNIYVLSLHIISSFYLSPVSNLIFHNEIICVFLWGGGTRWRSWLRHCATNRNVAGSIPNGVTGIFH
jgi:hypothetical protein